MQWSFVKKFTVVMLQMDKIFRWESMYNNKKKTIYLLMNLINALCVVISCVVSIELIDYVGLLRPWAKRNIVGYYVLVAISYFITFMYLHPYEEIFNLF